ncbi:MAG: gliding motility-associated C-terminal domain-containing protein [Bacteroidetes bacterium]|nr:gliding motility-associated C-terminal domain-containing protein [Bacteroidota bacterium]
MLSAAVATAQDLYVELTKTERPCELRSASVSIINGIQPIHILWSTGSTESHIEEIEQEGVYSVEIKDDHNHDTTIHFTLGAIICEPAAANNFTPNNDGYNDTWSIGRLENFPDFELFVYNRWGQLVHHQENQYIPWDGKSLTIPTPDATYYYILYLSKDNRHKFIKGDVSIIR